MLLSFEKCVAQWIPKGLINNCLSNKEALSKEQYRTRAWFFYVY